MAAVRGRGLLAALELRPAGADSLFLGYLQHQGLYPYAVAATLAELASVLVLPTLGAASVLRLAPPLTISDEELDLVVDGLESLCAQLDRNPAETIVRGIGALEERPRVPADAPPLVLPPPAWAAGAATVPARGRYAFLIHYTRPEDLDHHRTSLLKAGLPA